MRLHRRALLSGTGAVVVASAASAASAQSRVMRQRRSIYDRRAEADLDALALGMERMRGFDAESRQPPYHPLSWRRQIWHHAQVRRWRHHGTWRFLPWHRMQLVAFEQIIAALSGRRDFAMPFWDWQDNDGVYPTLFSDRSSPFFHERFDLSHTTLLRARADWDEDQQQSPARVFEDRFNTAVGGRFNNGSIENTGHNFLHVALGRDYDFGDPDTAPADPIFWFHHCNVDRAWAAWQEAAFRRGDLLHPDWLDEEFTDFVGGDGRPLSPMRTRDLLDTRGPRLGYEYAPAYQRRFFNIRVLAAPEGKTAFDPVGRVVISLSTPAEAGALRLPLPDDVLPTLARPREGSELLAEGTVRFSGPGLDRHAIVVTAEALFDDGKTTTVPVATMFSFGADHSGTHADHLVDDHGFAFEISEHLQAFVAEKEPKSLVLLAHAVPLKGLEAGSSPSAVSLALDLSVTDYSWR